MEGGTEGGKTTTDDADIQQGRMHAKTHQKQHTFFGVFFNKQAQSGFTNRLRVTQLAGFSQDC